MFQPIRKLISNSAKRLAFSLERQVLSGLVRGELTRRIFSGWISVTSQFTPRFHHTRGSAHLFLLGLFLIYPRRNQKSDDAELFWNWKQSSRSVHLFVNLNIKESVATACCQPVTRWLKLCPPDGGVSSQKISHASVSVSELPKFPTYWGNWAWAKTRQGSEVWTLMKECWLTWLYICIFRHLSLWGNFYLEWLRILNVKYWIVFHTGNQLMIFTFTAKWPKSTDDVDLKQLSILPKCRLRLPVWTLSLIPTRNTAKQKYGNYVFNFFAIKALHSSIDPLLHWL